MLELDEAVDLLALETAFVVTCHLFPDDATPTTKSLCGAIPRMEQAKHGNSDDPLGPVCRVCEQPRCTDCELVVLRSRNG